MATTQDRGRGGGGLPNWSAPPSARAPFAFLSAIRSSGLPGNVGADRAAMAVFCALEQRLPPAVAARFQAALPEELRDLFRRCDAAHAPPPDGFGKDEFMRRVGDHLAVTAPEAEEVTRSVLAGLREALPSRAAGGAFARLLPADLAVLWEDDDVVADGGAPASLPLP